MTDLAKNERTPTVQITAEDRAIRAAAAAKAGGRGQSANPLGFEQRADNYRRQTATLTARQLRRLRHKQNRNGF